MGRPPTARPRLRPLARGLPAAVRASLQGRPAPLAGAAARKGNSRLWAHLLAARRPQGAAANRGGGVGRRGGCRWARTAAACVGVVAAVATTQMGQEGLGHPFEKRMILPL
ncbi:hypothetical protein BHE74_00049652 [Ensete ventricosum]|nr:hypothetical protein BHE74_00049652 [Ensete ventricosum]